MPFTLPFFLGSLFCSWFQCESGLEPPYIHMSVENDQKLLSIITGYSEREIDGSWADLGGPLVYTKLGPVEGYVGQNSEGKDIYKFTGIPYGEAPIGHLRFRDPVPKNPWRGTLKATSNSPFCIQASGETMWMWRGQEDCLYLEVHTPRLPNPSEDAQGPGLPVIIWIPSGANIFGRTASYGSAYLLREDVVLVTINVRLGVLGYLATGDEASPGNWGMKDMALSIQWVHDNIAAFGGDPDRIIIGGLSAAATAAHSMLFTKHKSRDLIKGIFGMSGSTLANHGLDGKGRVLKSSDIVAEGVGCPTSAEGRSFEMVECLRKMDPYLLSAYQISLIYKNMPLMSRMWGPTIEPNVTNAFISELPEVLYERGEVPPIPLILTRTEDETGFYQQANRFILLLTKWSKWLPSFFKLAYRNTKLGELVTEEQRLESLRKLQQFYLGKDSMPNILNKKDFHNWVKISNDGFYNVPVWKALELHNKIAPTYSYVSRQRTYSMNKWVRLFENVRNPHYGAPHASDFFVVFNSSLGLPPLSPGSDFDIAARNLINMMVNFAAYGKPLYRNPSGELLPLWETIGDVNQMKVLDVGLVDNITMVVDPLPSTMRMKIWEQVKF